MEKFNHQEYRDNLAEKLKGIEDHEERKKVLEKEKKTLDYREAEKEKFSKTSEYQNYIEQINNLPNAFEKILFVTKDCLSDSKNNTNKRKPYGAFDDYSYYYNEECRMDVVRELQKTISTPEQLDEFLNVLMSSVHSYYNSIGISNEQFRGWDGHNFTKIIVEPIIIPTFIYGRNIDLVYTSAKYLFFSNAIMFFAEDTYKDNIDNPKSVEFKEYMESIGEGGRFK